MATNLLLGAGYDDEQAWLLQQAELRLAVSTKPRARKLTMLEREQQRQSIDSKAEQGELVPCSEAQEVALDPHPCNRL